MVSRVLVLFGLERFVYGLGVCVLIVFIFGNIFFVVGSKFMELLNLVFFVVDGCF